MLTSNKNNVLRLSTFNYHFEKTIWGNAVDKRTMLSATDIFAQI